MKEFNTTGPCVPSKHYMVDISQKVREIERLVDAGKYFTINRARQYGKTTTLAALKHALIDRYVVLALDFQSIDNDVFESGATFSQAMARIIVDEHEFEDAPIPEYTIAALERLNEADPRRVKMDELFRILKRWMKRSDVPVVLIVDEVDSATNNQVFLDFLAQLREGYIGRDAHGTPAFHSVVLAGVTDVRHLKSKIRDEDQRRVNSPWNIAADFNVDMSLPVGGIRGMLEEYEAEHHTGMDASAMATQIWDYTGGYPFLVSRLCQLIDEQVGRSMDLSAAWTQRGFEDAVRLILSENNALFQSLTKNLNNHPSLEASIRSVLMEGERLPYNAQQEGIAQLQMYGIIKNESNTVRISNRLFEMVLYNLFLSDEELKRSTFFRAGDLARNQFVENGRLNMRLIMERFIKTYTEVFGPLEQRFKEKDGREQFLLYLKPIINGTSNYYIEAQTRDQTRTDVVVDYLGRQYVVELKIWYGNKRHEDGERQISEYLDYFGLSTGYMLSFNFNKHKKTGVEQVRVGDKLLYEGML